MSICEQIYDVCGCIHACPSANKYAICVGVCTHVHPRISIPSVWVYTCMSISEQVCYMCGCVGVYMHVHQRAWYSPNRTSHPSRIRFTPGKRAQTKQLPSTPPLLPLPPTQNPLYRPAPTRPIVACLTLHSQKDEKEIKYKSPVKFRVPCRHEMQARKLFETRGRWVFLTGLSLLDTRVGPPKVFLSLSVRVCLCDARVARARKACPTFSAGVRVRGGRRRKQMPRLTFLCRGQKLRELFMNIRDQ